ncbi:MAG: hypothetical protein NZ920_02060 [Aigarchaeota archaeon]|nr:hypothetical protein [Aigarchaeota archaeon]MDW8092590.1 hypothetical protein [Nitrososphaerota archaeon]
MKTSLYITILNALQRNSGKMLNVNLVDYLRGKGLQYSGEEVMKALLVLEVMGKLRVISLDEERKVIELIS